jgi:hypothetical protein
LDKEDKEVAMTLSEIYEYYGCNWARVARELKLGSTTLQKWNAKGYVPIRSQMVIEKRTDGLFKARIEDAQV